MEPARFGQKAWKKSLSKVGSFLSTVAQRFFNSRLSTGLRQYWESPWATYSRGRSRWRNQFLVDYLQKAGIDRSKKQVASHIQVLRNMWKGEPGLLSQVFSNSISELNLFCPCRIPPRCGWRGTFPRNWIIGTCQSGGTNRHHCAPYPRS
jgi:hypothetical protein